MSLSARIRLHLPARLPLVLVAVVLLLAGAGLILAQGGQAVEVTIEVPGLGQPVASGPYLFKFAIVDPNSQTTLWSSDGTNLAGTGEPRSALQMFVDNGFIRVMLGDSPGSPLPPLQPEVLSRDDLVLHTWVANGASGFRRLPDRKLRGKGFSYASEQARNSERLEGKRANDFETAGAVGRHEERFVHTPVGSVPGGRFYNGQTDVGAGRELAVHFDVPHEDPRVTLTLHASPPLGSASLESLHFESRKLENQPAGATADVVDVRGSGWLAGVRESWDWCSTCFKRKLPPDTQVFLDGVPFDTWKAGRPAIPEGATVGRLDHLAPLGLVRFDRSLKVTSKNTGADQATGLTTVWYYTTDRGAEGSPGAVQVLVDGGDVTAALVGLPEGSPSFRTAAGRMVAARFDDRAQAADALDASPLLVRPADETWLTRGTVVTAKAPSAGASLLVTGEVALQGGDRRFALEGKTPAALELLVGNRWQRLVALTTGGTADATVNIPDAGWYQVRALASGPTADLSLSWLVDGSTPRVRTVPLLGGEGAERWSAGPLNLAAAGIPLPPGPHVLTLRERSGRDGHIEYGLLVE